MPEVVSFDERSYRCKAGDTFESISAQFYQGSQVYGPALMLYNRNHAQRADAFRTEPVVLQAGHIVYIPPTSILENRYPSAIPGFTPLPAAMPPPAPLIPAAVQRPSNASPTGAVYYRVRSNNESFWTIAEKTLAAGGRWNEIYRLNPTYNPGYPIPPGQVLKLPGDARVDQAHRP
jgi:nucleoid-associated protein YgaU